MEGCKGVLSFVCVDFRIPFCSVLRVFDYTSFWPFVLRGHVSSIPNVQFPLSTVPLEIVDKRRNACALGVRVVERESSGRVECSW